ncbi:Hypothetical predicted protein [Mytilus galloprovincialis]|uniref:Uncharacterized protein n=1 Tax=Mytilus galloprovincialis TaxID=29158 RepID=A0A8B6ENV0_MYTGA|nr:Hypothetical predicted protein [Mytilus galloprovincialis]
MYMSECRVVHCLIFALIQFSGVLPETEIREKIVQVETESLQSAAPPFEGVDYDARQKTTETESIQQEQYKAGQVEPDMAQIVESLREDLMPEGRDVTRKRKMTTSSSSSSDYESDKEVEGIPQETKKISITENEETKTETLGDGGKPKQETNIRETIDEEKRKSSSSSSSEDESDRKVRPPPSTVEIEEVNKEIKEQPADSSGDQQLPVKQIEITQEVKSRSSSSSSSASEKSEGRDEVEKEATKSSEEQVPQTKQIEITEEKEEVVEKVKSRSSSSSSSSTSEQDVERGEETVEMEKQEVIKGKKIPPAKQTEERKEVIEEVRTRSGSSSSNSSGGQETDRKENTKDVLEATEQQTVFERDDIPASKHVEISEEKREVISDVRPDRTRSTSSSSSRSSVSDKEIDRQEQTIDVVEKVVEVRKQPVHQVPSTKQTSDQSNEETKPRSSSSSSSSSSEDEKIDVKKDVIEVTKTEVVTSQIPPSIQSEGMVGSNSPSSSDDEDSRPGCEVNITQTTVIKIKEERPKTTIQEIEVEDQSIEKHPGSRSSSSSSSGPKSPKRKGSSGSDGGGYSSGSSSEGQDSSSRVLSQVERQERFETVEKKKLLGRDGLSTVETETEVFDANLSGGQSMYEETLPDGTVVRHTKMHTIQHPSVSGDIELVEEEGPEREVVDYDEDENILPDGTVHRVTKIRRHSLKHIHRSVKSEDDEKEIFEGEVEVPGSTREEIVEVYEDPPRFVKDVEEVDVRQPDGSIIKRKVTSGRVVHKIKTRSLSIDESGNVEEEEYSVDEVVPMTESAFAEGVSSSSSSDTVSSDSEDDEAQQVRANPGFMKENRMHVHFRSDEPDFEGDDFLPEQEFHECDESGFAKRDITKISYEPRLQDEESSSFEEYDEEDTDQSLPPAILITEDNTIPPEEGSDVLAYFGIKNPADTSLPPDITITEDNTIPPEEGSDVLAYFGIKNPGQILLQYKTNIWYFFRF